MIDLTHLAKEPKLNKNTILSDSTEKKTTKAWCEIIEKEMKLTIIEPTSNIRNSLNYEKYFNEILITKEEFMASISYSNAMNSYVFFDKW